MRSLGAGDERREKRFGFDDTGTGHAYSMRAMTGADVQQGGLKVSGEAVPEGSLFQLHLDDSDHATSSTRELVQVHAAYT